jgi:PadR family transcriptional regulator, regulatory protein AphA
MPPPPLPLTPTSYVVLGIVAHLQPVTSYAMKQFVAQSIGYFWPFPHSQLYAEPARLLGGGLLEEDVEAGGRKRRRYTITDTGRAALARWLRQPTSEPTEIRDLGMLKLFFGAVATEDDRRSLATEQARAHEARRDDYDALRHKIAGIATPWQLETLELGMRFERAAAAFWRELSVADP